MKTRRMTMAQAAIAFLKAQWAQRDGVERPFFAGCSGIFGHGNLAGLGQALQENPDFVYRQSRNEQAMVHSAAAFAKASRRLRAMVCTTSVGPGATNMLTGAAGATINRLPVLLLPGDVFARRQVAPVLQQLEYPGAADISVNDCFRPVSRFFDRILRPEQLLASLPEAMRVLVSPAETGAVTVAMPQDVQTEAYDYPAAFFEKRIWTVPRVRPDLELIKKAAAWIEQSQRPLIIAGGGVLYSAAEDELAYFSQETGIPIAETQAGKGSAPRELAGGVGAIGATGTLAANLLAESADLVIGVGTRYSDFTTSSKTAFQNPHVRFININVTDFDACKHGGLALVGDARAVLEELGDNLDFRISGEYESRIREVREEWDREAERLTTPSNDTLNQAHILGELNRYMRPQDVVVAAAGSLPGDLHKLWRPGTSLGYHLEYGYSCMGYEIAGALGVKMACPEREVYALVGDASYLMMAQEIVTAVQEGVKINVIVLDNKGYGSIGGLSQSLGSAGFGTRYRYRNQDSGQLDGSVLPVDLVANAASLGARTIAVEGRHQFRAALDQARDESRTTVLVLNTEAEERVPGYQSWWDVPVAEVSDNPAVRAARDQYELARRKQRYYGVDQVPAEAPSPAPVS